MLSVGTPTELTFELHKANSILQEPNNLFILETHISSSTVFAQQSPIPSGQEFSLTDSSHSYWSQTYGPRGTTHGTSGRRPWLWMVSRRGFLLPAGCRGSFSRQPRS